MMISKCDAPLYIELMCDGDIRGLLQKEKDLKFTLEDATNRYNDYLVKYYGKPEGGVH